MDAMGNKKLVRKRSSVAPDGNARRLSSSFRNPNGSGNDEESKATPALCPGKSLASSPSLPTTPLSHITTVPSSPEVELGKRNRASPAPNRAFSIALQGAFKSNRKVTPDRVKPSQLEVEVQDEEEPLIDLSGNWQKISVRGLDHFVLTVKPNTNLPEQEQNQPELRHGIADTKTSSGLSPWSKPFNPRITDGHNPRLPLDRHLGGLRNTHNGTDSGLRKPDSRVSESIFKFPPITSSYGSPPSGLRILGPQPFRPTAQPPPTTLARETSTVPLFAPRAKKVVSVRAPPPLQASPETPSKVEPGNSAPDSLVKTRIPLPYEDDYDSNEDPFYPVMTNTHRPTLVSAGSNEMTSQTIVKGLELQLDGPNPGSERQQEEERDDSASIESNDAVAFAYQGREAAPGNLPPMYQDVFGEGAATSLLIDVQTPPSVLQPVSGAARDRMAKGEIESKTSPSCRSVLGQRVLPRIRKRLYTTPTICSELQAIAMTVESSTPVYKPSYNFTVCRAHLAELSCSYGKYCCFKHPELQESLSPVHIAQAELEMSREDQEKVNLGKIKGLLTTKSIAITPADGTALIVLYADAVCENAASRSESSAVLSIRASPSGTDSRLMAHPGQLAEYSTAMERASLPLKGFVRSGTTLLTDETKREISEQIMMLRHPPPDQEDID